MINENVNTKACMFYIGTGGIKDLIFECLFYHEHEHFRKTGSCFQRFFKQDKNYCRLCLSITNIKNLNISEKCPFKFLYNNYYDKKLSYKIKKLKWKAKNQLMIWLWNNRINGNLNSYDTKIGRILCEKCGGFIIWNGKKYICEKCKHHKIKK